jgi:hypothetical protein
MSEISYNLLPLLASRFTDGAAGFLILSLWSGGERYPTPFLH